MRVLVTDDVGTPQAGIKVEALNGTIFPRYTDNTNANGYVRFIATTDNVTSGSKRTHHNYTINVTDFTDKNETTFLFTTNSEFVMVLKTPAGGGYTNQPPIVVSLDGPPNGGLWYSNFVAFNFTVKDDRNVSNCTILLNETTPLKVRNLTVTALQNDTYRHNLTMYIPDGHYIWNVNCSDNESLTDEANSDFLLIVQSHGTLTSKIIYPATNINVNKHDMFNFTAEVRCNDYFCANVTAVLDPIIDKPEQGFFEKVWAWIKSFWNGNFITGYAIGVLVPMDAGEPFYTNTSNPMNWTENTCLENMDAGDACNVTWWVNATGAGPGAVSADFFAFFNSTNKQIEQSNTTEVTITVNKSNTKPLIYLNWPGNRTSINNTLSVNFNFTIFDNENKTINCSIYLDGLYNRSNETTRNATDTIFHIENLTIGLHTWQINCSDWYDFNASETRTFSINDTLSPSIIFADDHSTEFDSPDPQDAGKNVTIMANITDNVGIDTVMFNVSGTIYSTNLGNVFVDSDMYWINHNETSYGVFNYTIIANDSANNRNETGPYNFSIIDDVPPSIINITLNVSILSNVGDHVLVTAYATDNGQLANVTAEVTFPDFSRQNYSMKNMSGNRYQVTLLNTVQRGEYIVKIFANDTYKNQIDTRDRLKYFYVPPYITTDYDKYRPGYLVNITGVGFNPSIGITLDIKDQDGISVTGFPVIKVSNADGTINYSWSIPISHPDANMTLSATDPGFSVTVMREFKVIGLQKEYGASSILIPMDSKQSSNINDYDFLRAYGFVWRLLNMSINVSWIFTPPCVRINATDIDTGQKYDEGYCHGFFVIPSNETEKNPYWPIVRALRSDSRFSGIRLHNMSAAQRIDERQISLLLKAPKVGVFNRGEEIVDQTLDTGYIPYKYVSEANILAGYLNSSAYDIFIVGHYNFTEYANNPSGVFTALSKFVNDSGDMHLECTSLVDVDSHTGLIGGVETGPTQSGNIRILDSSHQITQVHSSTIYNVGGEVPTIDISNTNGVDVLAVDNNYDSDPNIVKFISKVNGTGFVSYFGGHIGEVDRSCSCSSDCYYCYRTSRVSISRNRMMLNAIFFGTQVNDDTSPTVINITPSAAQEIFQFHKVNISAIVSDNVGVTNVTAIVVWQGNSSYVSLIGPDFNSRYNYEWFNTSHVGRYNVTIFGEDEDRNKANGTTYFIVNKNHAPNITNLTFNPIIYERDKLNLSFTAVDYEGDTVYYYIYINGTLSANANVLNWTTTDTDSGHYNITFFVNDSWGLSNRSERTVIIKDINAPLWSLNKTNVSSSSSYDYSKCYQFNITWVADIDNVTFETNMSGILVNESSILNDGDEYYYEICGLAAGHYTYSWNANKTDGHFNKTHVWTYIVAKQSVNCALQLPGPITYPSMHHGNCSCYTEALGNEKLFVNGTDKQAENGTLVRYAAGHYNYSCNASETENKSYVGIWQTFIINKGLGAVNLLLNDTDGDFSQSEGWVNVTGFLISGEGNITLHSNFTEFDIGGSRTENISQWVAGSYNITVMYNDTQNYTGAWEMHVLKITDDSVPTWSLNKTNVSSGSPYNYGSCYQFNITWAGIIDNVTFETNMSGVLFNESSILNNGNEYYFEICDLPAGIYQYSWNANKTNGQYNKTPVWTYIISKAITACSLQLPLPVTYPSMYHGNCSCYTEALGNEKLFVNGTDKQAENGTLVRYAAGHYNYSCNATDTENKSYVGVWQTFVISKGIGAVNLLLNDTDGDYAQDKGFINVTGYLLAGEGNITLHSNFTEFDIGGNVTENISYWDPGVYNITVMYNATQNYTGAWEMHLLTITENLIPGWSLNKTNVTTNSSYSKDRCYQFNVTWIDSNLIDNVTFETNFTGVNLNDTGTNFSNEFSYTVCDLAAGHYHWKSYANDTTGLLNSTHDWLYIVAKAASAVNLTLNGTDGNYSQYKGHVNVTGLRISGEANVSIYQNYSFFKTNVSRVYDVRGWSKGHYNITLIHNETENYTVSKESHLLVLTENALPNVTNVYFVSSTNYTNVDIKCYANITDSDSTNVYANYTWLNGSTVKFKGQSGPFVQGTNNLVVTLNSSNTTKHDNWTCMVVGYDGINYSKQMNSTIEILNSPPVQNQTLPSVSITKGQNLTNAFNLSNHFYDIDDDNLSFNSTGAVNINVTVHCDVCFYPPPTYTGTENVIFNAFDGEALTASNVVVVTVSDNSGGGGGGGGGGGSDPPVVPPIVEPPVEPPVVPPLEPPFEPPLVDPPVFPPEDPDIVVLDPDPPIDDFDDIINNINRTLDKINIKREFVFNNLTNKTEIRLVITADEDMARFYWYESIPKCMALYIQLVVFKNENFKIIMDDPVVMWMFEDVKKGETFDLSYDIIGQIPENCIKILKGVGLSMDDMPAPQCVPIMGLIPFFVLLVLSMLFTAWKFQHKKITIKKHKRWQLGLGLLTAFVAVVIFLGSIICITIDLILIIILTACVIFVIVYFACREECKDKKKPGKNIFERFKQRLQEIKLNHKENTKSKKILSNIKQKRSREKKHDKESRKSKREHEKIASIAKRHKAHHEKEIQRESRKAARQKRADERKQKKDAKVKERIKVRKIKHAHRERKKEAALKKKEQKRIARQQKKKEKEKQRNRKKAERENQKKKKKQQKEESKREKQEQQKLKKDIAAKHKHARRKAKESEKIKLEQEKEDKERMKIAEDLANEIQRKKLSELHEKEKAAKKSKKAEEHHKRHSRRNQRRLRKELKKLEKHNRREARKRLKVNSKHKIDNTKQQVSLAIKHLKKHRGNVSKARK
ncbi:MAG: hypothetical protein KJ922_06995 [Nanoarchaeota archaeon]|nr:hypothetical protein [Nanoarchaeota archaeon]